MIHVVLLKEDSKKFQAFLPLKDNARASANHFTSSKCEILS